MSSDREIMKELSQLAHKMFAKGGGAVFLYGSRAKGSARHDSDWDILIVTEDLLSTDDNFASFAFPFAEIGWRHGVQVTPIHYTRSQWLSERNSAFYHNVVSNCIQL